MNTTFSSTNLSDIKMHRVDSQPQLVKPQLIKMKILSYLLSAKCAYTGLRNLAMPYDRQVFKDLQPKTKYLNFGIGASTALSYVLSGLASVSRLAIHLLSEDKLIKIVGTNVTSVIKSRHIHYITGVATFASAMPLFLQSAYTHFEAFKYDKIMLETLSLETSLEKLQIQDMRDAARNHPQSKQRICNYTSIIPLTGTMRPLIGNMKWSSLVFVGAIFLSMRQRQSRGSSETERFK